MTFLAGKEISSLTAVIFAVFNGHVFNGINFVKRVDDERASDDQVKHFEFSPGIEFWCCVPEIV